MDGISVAASLVALVQVTGAVISVCYELRSGRNAPRDALRISAELINLRSLLERALDIVNAGDDAAGDDRKDARFSSLSVLAHRDGAIAQCQDEITNLLKDLRAATTRWKVARQKISWPLRKRGVTRKLQAIERFKSSLGLALDVDHAATILQVDQKTSQLKNRDDERQRQELLNWLCPVDYREQQRDIISRREEGTGGWFFGSPVFTEWHATSSSSLLCPGDPGVGKTVIAAAVAERLMTEQSASMSVVQLYCNYQRRSEQTAAHLLGGILRQSVENMTSFPREVQALYDANHRDKTPSLQDLKRILPLVLGTFVTNFVIVDALDECDDLGSLPSPRASLLEVIRQLQVSNNVKCFCTSRKPVTLDEMFGDVLRLEILTPDCDIELYVTQRMPELPRFVRNDPSLQAEVALGIAKAASGVFLLAKLGVEELRDKLSLRTLRLALQRLPMGSSAYALAYERALERIVAQRKGHRDIAIKALSWVACAQRPLRPLELRYALAVELEDVDFRTDSLIELQDILETCAGLVVKDDRSNTIRLVHFTLQQFFDESKARWLPDAEIKLAAVCVTYLSFQKIHAGLRRKFSPWFAKEDTPFLFYAACFWGDHIRKSEGAVPLTDEWNRSWQAVLRFTRDGPALSTAYNGLGYVTGWDPRGGHSSNHCKLAIQSAAYFGVSGMLAKMLSTSLDTLPRQWLRGLPLLYACFGGHMAAVQVLLDHQEVDVNATNGEYSPLGLAVGRGNSSLVRFLLDRGADPNLSPSIYDIDPLTVACRNGNAAIVQLLLENGARFDGIQLNNASARGHLHIVQILLGHGADVNLHAGSLKGSALHEACRSGHDHVAKFLISYGADIHAQNIDRASIFHAACFGGLHDIVRTTLDGGVDINSQDDSGKTGLLRAIQRHQLHVIRLLLDRGAHLSARDWTEHLPNTVSVVDDEIEDLLEAYGVRRNSVPKPSSSNTGRKEG